MLPFKFFDFAVAFCIIPPVLAQQNGTVFQVEAVKAHFKQSGLVPTVFHTLAPSAFLGVSFSGVGSIAIGQPVSREQALYEPSLSLTVANASIPLRGTYTIMMFDAGPPGADQAHGQRRHWLVNGVIVPLSSPSNATMWNVSMVGSTAITHYIPPNPPVGNGPHRYVLLVFAQPDDFFPPADLFQANTGGGIFAVENYARYSRLGPIVAASYFTCQRGPATITLPPTSAVISATLSGWTGSQPTHTTPIAQKANSGLSATHNALALLLAPIMGFLAL